MRNGNAIHYITGQSALRGVSFAVAAGEIVWVAGVSGNGQREPAEVIAGLRPLTDGAVHLNGQKGTRNKSEPSPFLSVRNRASLYRYDRFA